MLSLAVRVVSEHNHATPLEELLVKYNAATNAVTKSVYRDIISARLGIRARQEEQYNEQLSNHIRFMRKLTYSFESRSKMEKYFDNV